MEFGVENISGPEKGDKKEKRSKKSGGEIASIPEKKETPKAVEPGEGLEKILKKLIEEKEDEDGKKNHYEADKPAVDAETSEEHSGKLTELEKDEEYTAVDLYGEMRSRQLEREETKIEQGSPEEAAVLASELFMQNLAAAFAEVHSQNQEPEPEVEALINQAAAKTEQKITDIAGEDAPAPESRSPRLTFQPEGEIDGDGEILLNPTEDFEDVPEQPITAEGSSEMEPPEPPSAGGGNEPPAPPLRPGPGESGENPFGRSRLSAPEVVDGPNIYTPPRAPETVYYRDTSREFGSMLMGGIIGYLIGRRRGRIKTEKRLKPIQEKLEQKVGKLHELVYQKEQSIRSMARQKINREDAIKKLRREKGERVPAVAQQRSAPETVLAATPNPSTEKFPEKIAAAETRPEKLSHELGQKPRAEFVDPRVEFDQPPDDAGTESKNPGGQNIERLSDEGIARIGKEIRTGGTSVYELYQAKRITSKGLKNIVGEYLRGGSVEKALHEELLREEVKYERDPELRGEPFHARSASNTIESMAERAMSQGQNFVSPSDQLRTPADHLLPGGRHQRSPEIKRQADIVLGATIAVLIVVAFIIWLTR